MKTAGPRQTGEEAGVSQGLWLLNAQREERSQQHNKWVSHFN